MKMIIVDINKLRPMDFGEKKPNNEILKKNILEYGIQQPLYITKDFRVFNGCRRLEIAKELGIQQVPVQIFKDITDKQIIKFREIHSFQFVPSTNEDLKRGILCICRINPEMTIQELLDKINWPKERFIDIMSLENLNSDSKLKEIK